jgi:predicted peptidase
MRRQAAIGALSVGATAAALWHCTRYSMFKTAQGHNTAASVAAGSEGAALTAAALEAPEGSQIEHRISCGSCETGSFGFLLYLPKGYRTGKEWPVVYHLHGGGESERQQGFGPLTEDGVNLLSAVKAHGLPAIVEGEAPPCVVVAPQCPKGAGGWGSASALTALETLADLVSEALHIDANRQYLTGLSMGGYGTWSWAVHSPHRFAAIAPVCGGWREASTRASAATAIAHVPHYIAHGANDKIVPVSASDEMVEALRSSGADDIIYCRYPISPAPYQPTDWSSRRADGSGGAPLAPSDLTGHDSWTQTYTDPKFFSWLFSKTNVKVSNL